MIRSIYSKTIAALYIRVSSEEQVEGFSLDAQREALLEYCQREKMDVYKIYMDAGLSGKSIKGRPALKELLEDATQRSFQTVICLRLNRLSRNLPDLLYAVELFDKHGISLHSLTEQFQTETPVGKFVLQMMGATAQLEREQISQNTQLGMNERSKQGKWNSGNQVLGYRWNSNPSDPRLSYLEVIPEEADLVRSIFEMYVSNLGLKAITNQLNKAGHRTKRDKPFNIASVRGILTNYNYIGKITYYSYPSHLSKTAKEKQVVMGEHEPIIAIELWEQVQHLLSLRSHSPLKKVSHHFVLSGLIKCPDCGQGMVPSHIKRHRSNGDTYFSLYYICGRYSSHGSVLCRPNHINAEVIEQWVSEQIRLFLTTPSIAKGLVTEINRKRDKQLEPYLYQLKQIDSQAHSLKNRSLRCFELFEDGHLDNLLLKERLEEIRIQTEILEIDRSKLKLIVAEYPVRTHPTASVLKALGNFHVLLQSASDDQRKTLFQSLINKISIPSDRDVTKSVIHGKAALFNLSIPLIEKGE